MVYKTILVHVDASRHAPARMRLAARLARANDACLVGLALTGVSRAVFPQGYDVMPGTPEASYFEPLAQAARRALGSFVDIAVAAEVRHDARFACDQAGDGLVLQARFADLVVISQDDPDEAPAGSVARVPDQVILACSRPVLVVPRKPAEEAPMHRVLLAWDGSREAAFAASMALPLLRRAHKVKVVALARRDAGDQGLLQMHELLAFLARHHVEAETIERPCGADAGATLLAIAREHRLGLLVMGCYGHSRLRELCLGGASRTVLADAEIPVLMAH